ncbi:MAG: hypothetical protein AB7T59_16840 [Hyphomonadaceae bacterium]
MTQPADESARRDLSARRGSFIAVWVMPIGLAGLITAFAAGPGWIAPGAWTAALAWMGGACLLNARRCRRLHCYFSGPLLLLGALASLALGAGVLDLGDNGLTIIVLTTLALASMTYGLEYIWGRYRS